MNFRHKGIEYTVSNTISWAERKQIAGNGTRRVPATFTFSNAYEDLTNQSGNVGQMYSPRKYTVFHVLGTDVSSWVLEVAYSGGDVYHESWLLISEGNSSASAIPRLLPLKNHS